MSQHDGTTELHKLQICHSEKRELLGRINMQLFGFGLFTEKLLKLSRKICGLIKFQILLWLYKPKLRLMNPPEATGEALKTQEKLLMKEINKN